MTSPHAGAIRHPMNRNAYYRANSDGTVMVTAGDRWGRFQPNGKWIDGPLVEADPELCVWVAQPRPARHHRLDRVAEISGER